MLNITRSVIRGRSPLPEGDHQVRAEFAYDGGGLGKGGNVTLYVDGEPVGDGRIDRTHTTMFSFDETTDVGADTGSPVTDDYPAERNGFTGTIKWIEINLGDDDHNHLIDPDDVYRLMVIRQ
jgi:arylsulfatase